MATNSKVESAKEKFEARKKAAAVAKAFQDCVEQCMETNEKINQKLALEALKKCRENLGDPESPSDEKRKGKTLIHEMCDCQRRTLLGSDDNDGNGESGQESPGLDHTPPGSLKT